MAKKKALRGGGGGTATVKIPQKKTAKHAAKKTPKAKTGELSVAGQSGKFAADQPPIGGLEDTDLRIPELDELCKGVLANSEKRRGLKQDTDDFLEEIGKLLDENDLDCYIMQGEKFFIEPGVKSVKHKKIQQKG